MKLCERVGEFSCDFGLSTYPDHNLFCQEWTANSNLNLTLAAERWIFDAPTGVSNVQVTLSSNVDFDLKLVAGYYAESEDPIADYKGPPPAECYLGYGCNHAKAGSYVLTDGNGNSMTVDFSGDVRSAAGELVETVNIETVTFPVAFIVRAWDTGEGEVSWTWDGLSDCDLQGGENCIACENYDCNDGTPVCFGAWPPSCDYSTAQAIAPCNEIKVDLPSCLTAAPSVIYIV